MVLENKYETYLLIQMVMITIWIIETSGSHWDQWFEGQLLLNSEIV